MAAEMETMMEGMVAVMEAAMAVEMEAERMVAVMEVAMAAETETMMEGLAAEMETAVLGEEGLQAHLAGPCSCRLGTFGMRGGQREAPDKWAPWLREGRAVGRAGGLGA